MIQEPNNWDKTMPFGDRAKLKPGGYVIEIRKVEVKTGRNNPSYRYLDLTIDIAEGAYKDFFTNDYQDQTFEQKKYKGHFRQGVPAQDAKPDDMTARTFKGMITAIEKSNEGYTWNWDEQSLVGKKVGCLFRAEEFEYNGYKGMSTKPWRMTDAEKIRQFKYQVPEPKMLSKDTSSSNAGNTDPGVPAGFEAINDEDIPF